MIIATLLPFKGEIVWSGICETYDVSIGPNMRRDFFYQCKEARKRKQIITEIVVP
jgi:hypothetical protein